METFQEKFCQAEECAPEAFDRRVFWHCLHRHAIPFAPVIQLFNRRYFTADRELVARVRRAEDMMRIWEEVREYFSNLAYAGWLHKRANIRISAHRLIELAKQHLPTSGPPPRIGLPED